MKKYYYVILLLLSIFTCYSQDNEIYSMAETRPQPNEDIVKVGKKIAQNIPCLKTGINYYFNFIVEKDGSFSNVNLVRGELDTTIENCNESIQTAFANSPKWIPGKNGNIPVRIQFMLIIKKESDNNVEEDVKNDISNSNGNNNIGKSETVDEIGSFYFSYERKRNIQESEIIGNLENKIDENSYWKKKECGLWMVMIGDIHKEGGGYKTFDEWYNDYKKNINKQLIGKSILNKPDGEWSYKDGRYEVKGNFIQGKPNGKWEYRYYEKHILKSEKIENYKDGVPDGEWFVLVDGIKDIYSVENFVLGKREGLCYLNYDYEKKVEEIMEIHFKNGIPNGKYSIYYMGWKTGEKKIFMNGIHENGYIKEMEMIYQPEYEKNEGEFGQNMKSGKVLVSRKIEIDKNLNKFIISEKYADVYNKEHKLKPNQKLIPNEKLNVMYEYERVDGCDIKDEIYFFPHLTRCDRYKQYGGNWIAK